MASRELGDPAEATATSDSTHPALRRPISSITEVTEESLPEDRGDFSYGQAADYTKGAHMEMAPTGQGGGAPERRRDSSQAINSVGEQEQKAVVPAYDSASESDEDSEEEDVEVSQNLRMAHIDEEPVMDMWTLSFNRAALEELFLLSYEEKYAHVVRKNILLGILIYAIPFSVLDVFEDDRNWRWRFAIRLGFVTLPCLLLVLYDHIFYRWRFLGRVDVTISAAGQRSGWQVNRSQWVGITAGLIIGIGHSFFHILDAGNQENVEIMAMIILLCLFPTLGHCRFVFCLGASWSIFFVLVVQSLLPGVNEDVSGSTIAFNLCSLAIVNIVFCMIAWRAEWQERVFFHTMARLKLANKQSHELLSRMLPPQIIESLKHGQQVIAKGHESATVLFSDFHGFASTIAHLPPVEVVRILDVVFSLFDFAVDHHGIYKVETVGSSYMAVSGVPVPVEDHAWKMALLARDFLQIIKEADFGDGAANELGPALRSSLTVGLNSGPLIAGVIGNKLPRFRLFGDTVNTASRMCSRAPTGTIMISNTTASLLRPPGVDTTEWFEGSGLRLLDLGVSFIKGKGEMNTFRLQDVSAPAARADHRTRKGRARTSGAVLLSSAKARGGILPPPTRHNTAADKYDIIDSDAVSSGLVTSDDVLEAVVVGTALSDTEHMPHLHATVVDAAGSGGGTGAGPSRGNSIVTARASMLQLGLARSRTHTLQYQAELFGDLSSLPTTDQSRRKNTKHGSVVVASPTSAARKASKARQARPSALVPVQRSKSAREVREPIRSVADTILMLAREEAEAQPPHVEAEAQNTAETETTETTEQSDAGDTLSMDMPMKSSSSGSIGNKAVAASHQGAEAKASSANSNDDSASQSTTSAVNTRVRTASGRRDRSLNLLNMQQGRGARPPRRQDALAAAAAAGRRSRGESFAPSAVRQRGHTRSILRVALQSLKNTFGQEENSVSIDVLGNTPDQTPNNSTRALPGLNAADTDTGGAVEVHVDNRVATPQSDDARRSTTKTPPSRRGKSPKSKRASIVDVAELRVLSVFADAVAGDAAPLRFSQEDRLVVRGFRNVMAADPSIEELPLLEDSMGAPAATGPGAVKRLNSREDSAHAGSMPALPDDDREADVNDLPPLPVPVRGRSETEEKRREASSKSAPPPLPPYDDSVDDGTPAAEVSRVSDASRGWAGSTTSAFYVDPLPPTAARGSAESNNTANNNRVSDATTTTNGTRASSTGGPQHLWDVKSVPFAEVHDIDSITLKWDLTFAEHPLLERHYQQYDVRQALPVVTQRSWLILIVLLVATGVDASDSKSREARLLLRILLSVVPVMISQTLLLMMHVKPYAYLRPYLFPILFTACFCTTTANIWIETISARDNNVTDPDFTDFGVLLISIPVVSHMFRMHYFFFVIYVVVCTLEFAVASYALKPQEDKFNTTWVILMLCGAVFLFTRVAYEKHRHARSLFLSMLARKKVQQDTNDLLSRLLPSVVIPPLMRLYAGYGGGGGVDVGRQSMDDGEADDGQEAEEVLNEDMGVVKRVATMGTGAAAAAAGPTSSTADGDGTSTGMGAQHLRGVGSGQFSSMQDLSGALTVADAAARSSTSRISSQHASAQSAKSGNRNSLQPGAIERCIAHHYDMVTVLQGDICGFTPMCAVMAPRDVVWLLNDLFFCFDQLTDRFGVHKIETIGDAYLAVAGAPTPSASHASQAAELALAMNDTTRQFVLHDGKRIEMRIGLHSGPVVGGVVGVQRMPRYHLFGETVSITEQVEQHAEEGFVHCSQTVMSLLGDEFVTERKGEFAMKNRSVVHYRLTRAGAGGAAAMS